MKKRRYKEQQLIMIKMIIEFRISLNISKVKSLRLKLTEEINVKSS